MEKLFKLREWLSLAEAAEHMARALGEPVTIADILHLGAIGKVTISANFVNHSRAHLGQGVTVADACLSLFPRLTKPEGDTPGERLQSFKAARGQVIDFPKHDRKLQDEWLAANEWVFKDDRFILTLCGDMLPDGRVLQFGDTLSTISGVWDIPMFGGASLDVEHALQQAIDGTEVTLQCLDGAVVVSPDGQRWAQLLESFANNPYADQSKKYAYDDPESYYPAGGLPEDAPMVVRTAILVDFLASLIAPTGRDNGAQRRKEQSYLGIIAAMRALLRDRDGGGFPSEAKIINQLVDRYGAVDGVSKRKLEDVFANATRTAGDLTPPK